MPPVSGRGPVAAESYFRAEAAWSKRDTRAEVVSEVRRILVA